MAEGAREIIRTEGNKTFIDGKLVASKVPAAVGRVLAGANSQRSSSSLHLVGASALRMSPYSCDDMNEEFAFIVIGKGPMIVWNRPGCGSDEDLRLITLDAFRAMSANARHEYEDEKGKLKTISYADKWLADPGRRDYAGLEFFPNPDGAEGKLGFLNLWQGFSVEPSEAGSYDVLRDHMLTNVCNGDPELFRWLFAWFAQIVQQPRRKPGTSVVFRGGMGYGKSIVGEAIGSLFSRHYVLADDARYLTGNFNAHMASCLLLQADEAIWAGDKHAEGRLKGMVTSTSQMIEGKGVDPVRIENHMRVMMTSNNDWVVPAGKDERRFAIFDVAGHSAQNHEYFGELVKELDAGGRGRLLNDLLALDLSGMNLREIPKTGALLEQKVHSLEPIDAWLLDRLQAGSPTRGGDGWPDFVPTRALIDDYVTAADKVGVHRKAFETQFGIRFLKLLPGARKARHSVVVGESVERTWGYELPTLARARSAFEEALGQSLGWDRSDEPWSPAPDA